MQREEKLISKTEASKPHINMLFPLPFMPGQDGFDCKTYALHAALKWLYDCKLITQECAPARKRLNTAFQGPSLRWHLKKYFQSAVGEVYNVDDLAAVAEINTQVAAYYCECKTEEEYIGTLVSAIDQKRPAVVFFDADTDPDREDPALAEGRNEHAAVVAGYYYKDDKLFFKISQWGRYTDVSAKELFQSANQLIQHQSVKENYFKIRTNGTNEGAWLPRDLIVEHGYSHRLIKRLRVSNPTKNNGLRGKILILDSKIQPGLDAKKIPVKLEQSKSKSAQSSDEMKESPSFEDKAWDEIIAKNRKPKLIEEVEEEIEEYIPAATFNADEFNIMDRSSFMFFSAPSREQEPKEFHYEEEGVQLIHIEDEDQAPIRSI